MKYYIYILFFLAIPAYSQSEDKVVFPEIDPDSTWNIEDLDFENLEFESDKFELYQSKGWFPIPYPWDYNFGIIFGFGDIYDYAIGITSPAFVPTRFRYSGSDPLSSEDKETIDEPFSDKTTSYSATGFTEYGLGIKLNLPVPAVIDGSVSISFQTGNLFDYDYNKSFLTINDKLNPLKEAGIIYLDETMLNFGIGLKIPFYGGYIKVDETDIGSSYYIFAGYYGSNVLSSDGSQYIQIANPKDQIRYYNGKDTVKLLHDVEFDGLNKIRSKIEFGIGLDFDSSGYGFDMGIYYNYYIDDVIKGTAWKQGALIFKYKLYFKGIF